MAASWIIENLETGKPILETYNREFAESLDKAEYRVWTALDWLVEVNRRARAGCPSVAA